MAAFRFSVLLAPMLACTPAPAAAPCAGVASPEKLDCLTKENERLAADVQQLRRRLDSLEEQSRTVVKYGEIFFLQSGVRCLRAGNSHPTALDFCSPADDPTRWTVQPWHE